MRVRSRTHSTSGPVSPRRILQLLFRLSPGRFRSRTPCSARGGAGWLAWSSLVLLLALCGCTIASPVPEGSTLPAPTTDASPLLVSGIDGNIYTIHRDGSNRRRLTDDASNSRTYTQPTWSPTGEQVAYSRMDTGAGDLAAALIVSQQDGTILEEVEVPYPPFYIYWSPQGDRLVYLSNWIANSMALRLVDLRGETADDTTLARGQPFYISWSPDGEKLLTHVGNEQTAIRSLDGAEQMLSTASTGFPAPQWSSDGESLLYAISDGDLQNLVVTNVDGEIVQEVTGYLGNITFSQSPTTSEIAYVVTETAGGFPTFGPLYVIDMGTLRTQALTDQPVLAFFWSPDGHKLAYVTVDAVGENYWLRWNVWDASPGESPGESSGESSGASLSSPSTTEFPRFLPSRTFLQRYLIFFDQYARSMNIWNPESSAFAYAGTSPTGRSGIWVQSLQEETPQRIGNGVFVTWSPR